MTLTKQRLIKFIFTGFFVGLFVMVCKRRELQLNEAAFFTGWALFLCYVILMLFNGIRKLSFFSFSKARFWSQFHIYLGFFSIVIYIFHVRSIFPQGYFELLLAILFYLLALSGILGIFIYRTFPKRLTRRGEEVIYERVPALCISIQNRAEALITEAAKQKVTSELINFYSNKLQKFFSGNQNFMQHLLDRNITRYRLLLEISGFYRFVNQDEKHFLDDLSELVQQKDDLDYHYALQTVLKKWLWIHIPLAYSAFLFVLLHIVLALIFSGN